MGAALLERRFVGNPKFRPENPRRRPFQKIHTQRKNGNPRHCCTATVPKRTSVGIFHSRAVQRLGRCATRAAARRSTAPNYPAARSAASSSTASSIRPCSTLRSRSSGLATGLRPGSLRPLCHLGLTTSPSASLPSSWRADRCARMQYLCYSGVRVS